MMHVQAKRMRQLSDGQRVDLVIRVAVSPVRTRFNASH